MFKVVVLLFMLIPAIEIILLIASSNWIGLWPTFLVIISTGAIGAYLAKKQGIAVIQEIRYRLGRGQVPAESLLDGACILVGGALLLTPGYVTDATGFALLIPATRQPVKYFIMKWIEKRIHRNTIIIR